MSLHKKINGFHPPASCPRDFSAQVQSIVWKYNKLIDDCDAYQQSLRDMSNNYRILSKKYEELQTASELLAEKHEKLLAAPASRAPRFSGHPVVAEEKGRDHPPSDEEDDEDDNTPLSDKEVDTVLSIVETGSKTKAHLPTKNSNVSDPYESGRTK